MLLGVGEKKVCFNLVSGIPLEVSGCVVLGLVAKAKFAPHTSIRLFCARCVLLCVFSYQHGAHPKQPKPRPSSGFYGVSDAYDRKRWRARLYHGGTMQNLGIFGTKQEAALAYDRAAREHGEGKKPLKYESIEAAEDAAAQVCAGLKSSQPRKPRPPSGFHGVSASGKRWAAQICYNSKQHRLGTFYTKQDAALAYDRAAREHGGGKKKLNYTSMEAAEEAAAHAQAVCNSEASGGTEVPAGVVVL
jgi:hypothetical protein